ncbi:GbsR/MarR family transcriptional regulator [Nonomuraea sp. NPDC049400]|uniref:GbsR/MarR family transcriptional regulator n=1 Tax=Nonomuraea sp. NPDC049400 TaxID=3364352 RepID=UPI00379EA727
MDVSASSAAGRDEQAVGQFVESLARLMAEWGFPRMSARVLLTMMSSDEDGLTAADLADRLDVSPPAISGAVRYLVQVGLVERRPVPGSRRDLYRIRDNAWYTSSATVGGVYQALADLSAEGVRALGGGDSPAGARIAEMHDFFTFVQKEIAAILNRWQQTRTSTRSS